MISILFFFMFLGLAAAVVVCLAFLTGGRSRREQSLQSASAPPAQRLSGQELLARKFALEQQMAGVAGGQTGMFVLLDMIENCPAGGDIERYRDSYRSKQKKLRGYMDEYGALLAQAAGLPEEERSRFVPEEELGRYRILADAQV